MDAEMQGIFDRADELRKDLDAEYELCLDAPDVSERAKNLYHEVLVKLRSALDMTMVRCWEKHENLSTEVRNTVEHRVQFPICDDEAKFKKQLKEWGLERLDKDNLPLYAILVRAQPFQTKRHDLLMLQEFSNLGKHVRLPAHSRTEQAAIRTEWNGGTMICTEGTSLVTSDGTERPFQGEKVNLVLFTTEMSSIDARLQCLMLAHDTRKYVTDVLKALK